MTKAELIEVLYADRPMSALSRRAMGDIVDAVFNHMLKAIKKQKRFHYPHFGTFEVKKRSARTGRNPLTGEAIKIKATKTVTFKPAKSFKDSLR
jgi:DNA-binding protein HU-beta